METPPTVPIRDPKATRRALLVCAVAVVFSLQVFAAGLVAPTFAEMYIDFGSQLPLLSRGVLASHYFWTLAGFGGVVWSVILSTWGKRNQRAVRRSAFAIAIASFLLGQTLTVALFLPVFQLSAVVGEEGGTQDK